MTKQEFVRKAFGDIRHRKNEYLKTKYTEADRYLIDRNNKKIDWAIRSGNYRKM